MFVSKNKLEKKVVKRFWDDGLLDVLGGLGILFIGIAWQFDIVPLGAIAPALLVPLWKPLRTKFTEPRLGLIEFSEPQQTRNRSFLLTSVLIGIGTLIGGVAIYLAARQGDQFNLKPIVSGLPLILLSFMAFLTAQITTSRRFIGYRFVLIACGLVTIWFELRPGTGMLIAGSMILATGIFAMAKFVHRYRISSEPSDGAKFDV